MTLGTFAAKGEAGVADVTGIRAAVQEAIQWYTDNSPRTLQRRIGPSELGADCSRQLAYKIMNHEENPNRGYDPWPSFLGTAAHARLDEALTAWEKMRPGTWLTERRLTIPGVVDGGSGTSDAYHVPSDTVVDWKVLGNTTYDEIKRNGPGRKYKVQAHVYGLGWAAAGFSVQRVALGVFGRAKPLSGMYVWSERFDPSYAAAALHRVRDIRKVVEWFASQGMSHPDLIPAVPGHDCYYCPFKGAPAEGFCQGGS